MIAVKGYGHFGGRHEESAALKNLLSFAGVRNPQTGGLFSEALCFGIAGGIGAGYSFCPSVVRHGTGSGVSVVGRHKLYATDAAWYQGFFDRIGATTRITETTSKGKAFQNLKAELEAGRPAVVWCSRLSLPFLEGSHCSSGLWMHTFVVHAIDEEQGMAHGAECAPTPVTLTLDQLAEARNGVASHKNRTLTFDPPKKLTRDTLLTAVREGVRACVKEMLQGKMKTFSLPGLEIWARMICNDTNKDGWGKVFTDGLLFLALRDIFDSIETNGTGSGLHRGMYADFLEEAAAITGQPSLLDLARAYRNLAAKWTELADAALPDRVKGFRQTKDLLRKKRQLFEEKGERVARQTAEATERLRTVGEELRTAFPLTAPEIKVLLEGLRERILELHREEKETANRLAALVS
jgi:Domain of unknown function (DUF4872)/Butirosin biosynthesis protein H, N-terminal